MKDLGVPTIRNAHTKHATIKVRYPKRWGWWVGVLMALIMWLGPLFYLLATSSAHAPKTAVTKACTK